MGSSVSSNPKTLLDSIDSGQELDTQTLVRFGAQINALNKEGYSPLRVSLEHGRVSMFKALYKAKALIIPELSQRKTPLHRAVELGHYKLAWMLLREHSLFGNFKNQQDAYGNTPLHVAVLKGNSDMVALLLKYNASRDVLNSSGKTPHELALESRSQMADEIIEQFTLEDCISKGNRTPILDENQPNREQRSTQGSKSTLKVEESIEEPITLLEQALADSRLTIIKGEELEFQDVLNRGSSCIVFKGKWRGSEVAIKQFKLEYSTSEKDLQKYIKEMQVLSQIRHPNVLLIMGICIDQPNLCLITEYVPNSSLFYAIHKNKARILTLSERFNIGIQICKALAYLHTNDPPIIHRDLKPENCLLDHAMNVKLADFGLARPVSSFSAEESQSMTTICIGTTRFMAPELFDKDKVDSIGVEVDIWALGCLLIELFSNKRPWHYISSSKASNIFYEIFNKKPIPIPDTITPEVSLIIQECCRYNPRRRPRITDVLDRLERAKSTYILS
ncbi:unnamed protein product [Blepharisma stoltei]|uniref:Protein kinase domain-containing protein n=1 Tax=Blepharisma stoltei TaxID=1481888 RepID=A0AAU9JI38_9CILI|nr:unnamed protein product [Blepharisma stoltei]